MEHYFFMLGHYTATFSTDSFMRSIKPTPAITLTCRPTFITSSLE